MKRLIPFLITLVGCSAFAEDGYQRGIKDIDGIPAFFYPGYGGSPGNDTIQSAAVNTITLNNATTQNKGMMAGHLYIDGSPTSAKSCTAAGTCAIYWRAGTISGFAGGDDSVDIGIQDVSTSAGPPVQPDGTYGVKGTFVGNVDPPTTAAWNTSDMETDGDDTSYSHGDLIAVVWDLTACNGCSLQVSGFPPGYSHNLPVSSYITGSAWTQAGGEGVNVLIKFDDGTFGWLDGTNPGSVWGTTTITTASTDDELGQCFTVPRKMRVDALWAQYGAAASADSNLTLYRNADTNAVSMYQFALDANIITANTVARMTVKTLPADSQQILYPGVVYAVAVQATTANNILVATTTLGDDDQRRMLGGTTSYACSRDVGSSETVFTTVSSNTIHHGMGVRVSGIGDR